VISDITRSMGSGMLVYYLESPDSLEQWNEVFASLHLIYLTVLLCCYSPYHIYSGNELNSIFLNSMLLNTCGA